MSDAAPAARVTPSVSEFTAVVLDSVVNTPHTKTLRLDLGAPAGYRAGQYVTIDPHQFAELRSIVGSLEQVKRRREAPRAYSLSSAPDEPCIAITVKEEVFDPGDTPFPPLLSGFLVHEVRAGDALTLRGFVGTYTLTDEAAAETDHVLHLCAGSGSVANLSILKDSLRRHPHISHTFVYSNRTWQDVIFRSELRAIRQCWGERVQVIHRLTRENGPLPGEADVACGRIDFDLLRTILAAHPTSRVFVCGPGVSVRERRAAAAQGITPPPPRFMETMLGYLDALAIPRAHIKVEAYG